MFVVSAIANPGWGEMPVGRRPILLLRHLI